ncbi:MAG TPA: sodium:solute symporter family protein [Candidatus Saccharimonadales bacterium]|nr:sodium:solute symporter family protein [Candidatus Saccharimonadales bacterium]
MNVFLIAILAYLLALAAIGIYKSLGIRSGDEFSVAGRSVPAWKLVATLTCTWIGSGSLIAGAGLAYRMGFSELWLSAGAWVGIACIFFLAGRARRIAQFTLPQVLERRYNATARVLGTITIVIAYTTIAGYQFRGGGMVLKLVAGIPDGWGILITAGFCVLYTALAGMVSVVALDVLNGAIIILAVVIAVPALIYGVGGWSAVTAALPADHFTMFGPDDIRHVELFGSQMVLPGFVWALGIGLPTFLLLLGESNMYQKFFSAESEKAARKAVVGWILGTIVVETLICVLAVVGSSHFKELGKQTWMILGSERTAEETIILHTARHGAEVGLPIWVGVLLLCGAVAIIVSTANAFLLTPSISLTRDIIQRFFWKNMSQKQLLLVQRLLVFVLAAVAWFLLRYYQNVLSMALTAYTVVGAGITPALVAAFLWKRVTVAGGVASIAGGMATTVGITILNGYYQASHGAPWLASDYIALVAAPVSIGLLVVVSLLTPPSPEEKWRPFVDAGTAA